MRLVLLQCLVVAALVASNASAAWNQTASGPAASRAKTLGAGNAPTAATAVSGKRTNVTVTWTASSFAEGGSVPGYVVRRYNASTGALQAVGANCSGVIAALSCTESNVAAGSWQYTITPAAGSWRGSESAKSATVKA